MPSKKVHTTPATPQPDSAPLRPETEAVSSNCFAVPGLVRTRLQPIPSDLDVLAGTKQVTESYPGAGLTTDSALNVLRRNQPLEDAVDPLGGTRIPQSVLSALRRNQGAGQPLPEELSTTAGRELGQDLSSVRVHADPVAADLARSVQAVAFTHGRDIYFSAGAYRPAEPGGRQLIAHELGHIGQRDPGGAGTIGRAGDPAEAAADRAATGVIQALRRQAERHSVAPNIGQPLEHHQQIPVPRSTPEPGLTSSAIHRKLEKSKIFDFVDQRTKNGHPVEAIELKNVLYWNDVGRFDSPDKLDEVQFTKFMKMSIPLKPDVKDKQALPEFMNIRQEFNILLPAFFGAGKLTFRKGRIYVARQKLAWISDNFYWRAPNSKVRYMLHAMLEWAGNSQIEKAGNPHLTLRNADMQADIDLDITNPLPLPAKEKGAKQKAAKAPTRVEGDLAVTNTSYSQGLGTTDREKGKAMSDDTETFEHLTGDAVIAWLNTLATLSIKT